MELSDYLPYISFMILFLFVVLIVFNITNRRTYICSILDDYKPEKDLTSKKLKDVLMNDMFVKSAYNCCCIGGVKNDYVDLCALKFCFKSNIRCLDFQIFSLNEEPIIAASSNKSFEYKEIYNYLSLGRTLIEVNQLFCNKYQVNSNINAPLFLNFRINSNNKAIFDKIYKYISNTFTDTFNLLIPDGRKLLKDYTFKELHNKVIIMVDIGESVGNKITFENSLLSDITFVKFGLTNTSTRASDATMDTTGEISCIYPNIHPYAKNYDSLKGFDKKFNFIFMNQQTYDPFIIEYRKVFKLSSFLPMNKYVKI
jgi:hypothetical protein